MSLLVEPANANACKRNEKERKLMAGELRQMSREDYLLKHLGLWNLPAIPEKAPERAPSDAGSVFGGSVRPGTGRTGPLRSASEGRLATPALSQAGSNYSRQSTLSQSGRVLSRLGTPGGVRGPRTPAEARALRMRSSRAPSIADSDMSSVAPPKPDMDPVLAMMMNGPPLFSPGLVARAATLGMAQGRY